MNSIQRATLRLAQACRGNPVKSTLTIMLFYVMFNIMETLIEKLIFGERFEHFLDLVFSLAFIAYAAYAVYWCAVYNSIESRFNAD